MSDLQVKILECLGIAASPLVALALFSNIPFSWKAMTSAQKAMVIAIADFIIVALIVFLGV